MQEWEHQRDLNDLGTEKIKDNSTPTQNNIKPYTSALLMLIPKVQYVLSELKQKKKKIEKHTKNARKNLKIQSKWKSHLNKKQILDLCKM